MATLITVGGCELAGPDDSPTEGAWTGSAPARRAPATAVADDSTTYTIYALIDELGRVDGILTIIGDTSLAYDPYEVVVEGVVTKDSAGNPDMMLAEMDMYDGARCRLRGDVDSLGVLSNRNRNVRG